MPDVHLSQAELRRMIGTDNITAQMAWLRERGWPFELNWPGDALIVGRDAASSLLREPKSSKQARANLAAVR